MDFKERVLQYVGVVPLGESEGSASSIRGRDPSKGPSWDNGILVFFLARMNVRMGYMSSRQSIARREVRFSSHT